MDFFSVYDWCFVFFFWFEINHQYFFDLFSLGNKLFWNVILLLPIVNLIVVPDILNNQNWENGETQEKKRGEGDIGYRTTSAVG